MGVILPHSEFSTTGTGVCWFRGPPTGLWPDQVPHHNAGRHRNTLNLYIEDVKSCSSNSCLVVLFNMDSWKLREDLGIWARQVSIRACVKGVMLWRQPLSKCCSLVFSWWQMQTNTESNASTLIYILIVSVQDPSSFLLYLYCVSDNQNWVLAF